MSEWTKESLETAFEDRGWLLGSRDIQHGLQFELREGVKVNFYSSGKTVPGGPRSEFRTQVEEFISGGVQESGTQIREVLMDRSNSRSQEIDRRVFIVYGHDIAARNSLELILRRMQVDPIILENIPSVGDTLIEKLESLTDADFACVLLTPDDIGAAKDTPDDLRPRARQNVVLELGMVLSRLGRRRVAILVNGEELEKPSDIDGLVYISYVDDVSEVATALGAALVSAGFDIDIRDLLGS